MSDKHLYKMTCDKCNKRSWSDKPECKCSKCDNKLSMNPTLKKGKK